MPLTHKVANDNVLYHAQIWLAGKGVFYPVDGLFPAKCGNAVLNALMYFIELEVKRDGRDINCHLHSQIAPFLHDIWHLALVGYQA
jgi:hypothetical protein